MPRWSDTFFNRLAVVKSLLHFLWRERLWWMIPMVLTLLLLGGLLFMAQQSAVAPFIYTLF